MSDNTYKELEEKTRKQLDNALERGTLNRFIDAKNLSATLINLLKAERMNNSLNHIK